MKKIIKNNEPQELRSWKRKNPCGRYGEIGWKIRQKIRSACISEQYGLCAFCCTPILDGTCHNAHLFSQDNYPHLSLDWNNIVASCNNETTCGTCQGTQVVPITPLMDECEIELIFYQSGRVKGITKRAQETIRILNLDSEKLKVRRKRAIEDFLYENGYFPPAQSIQEWDNEILNALINECRIIKNGKMIPYAPVLINICHHMLNRNS